MTRHQTTLSTPDCAPATLILPDSLTIESICLLEDAIGKVFRRLRNDLQEDRGAIEFDSWVIPAAVSSSPNSGEQHHV